ncbi:MAG: DUF4275 family protein [Firmicutes bacterium]|nr:DUF4275 family protein [Bacillota bacterium]
MDNAKVTARWLRTFARGVDEQRLQERVYADGNLMWHIFSWELAPHLSGAEADAAYAAAEDAEVLLFADGYSGGGKPTQIRDLQLIAKPGLDELPKLCKKLKIQDLYITATDYSWTYVQTHEGYLGPYFCRRPLFDWEKEPANGQA